MITKINDETKRYPIRFGEKKIVGLWKDQLGGTPNTRLDSWENGMAKKLRLHDAQKPS